ncbi:MAG TPA: pitrilysin family protein [Bacteroidia bacterium]|jgi:zinc protease|nr:pitrilysin family protein [Bacteroidia bacterium]
MGLRKLRLTALALFFTCYGSAQTKLIEKVVKKGNEVVIPYEKYQLANGLTVIVHEDHSDPMVFVQVTYHVGSAREQEGRSGFAHFFEHMMFQGSDHVGENEHSKMLSSLGASLIDGQTDSDQTRYHEVIPSNQLETVLWLESDRMGYFLDAVTQERFEIQRSTVKNEKLQNVENVPYGKEFEEIRRNLYPEGHPYSWSVLGYVEDLNRVDVSDLKKFFLRWYNPNNATLTIAGDAKTVDVIKMVEKYFASIPAGPAVKSQLVNPVVLTKDRYTSYEDNNINAPELVVSFPTVPNRHPDEAPLDALAFIIGGNKSSLFERKIVNTGVASYVNVWHPASELAGHWEITLRGFQGVSLSILDSLCRQSLDSFEKTGITDEELRMFKANYEMMTISTLQGVKGKGEALSTYQVFTGNPNYIVKDFQRYKSVTKEDVMRVYNKYIKHKPALYLSVYPKGKPDLVAKPDNFPPIAYKVSAEREEYKNLVYKKGQSLIDRSIRPVAPPTPSVKTPDYWTAVLDNGVKVIGTVSKEMPIITIQLSVEAGHRFEPLGKSGISELLVAMMNQSTEKYSKEEISNKLNLLGSTITITGSVVPTGNGDGRDWSNAQEIVVTISTLTKNLDATLALATEMIFHSKFDKQEFERVKKQQLDQIENLSSQPKAVVNNVFSKLLYGNDHIMSTPIIGTKETVEKLTLEDVKDYYTNKFSQNYASLIIVGDINEETILPKLTAFKQWNNPTRMHSREPSLPTIEKTRIYFVNKTNAPQSEIRIGYMAMPFDATGKYYRSTIMNYPLGKTFTSRINMNLRERHGYTYYSRSYFSGDKFVGPYTAYAGVRADVTDSSVIQFIKIIKHYADNGISKTELEETKSSIAQQETQSYETPIQKVRFIKKILDYGLEKDFTEKQSAILKSLTVEQINELAKQYLPYDKMHIVVLGDKAKVLEGLKKIGYEVVELNANGDIAN